MGLRVADEASFRCEILVFCNNFDRNHLKFVFLQGFDKDLNGVVALHRNVSTFLLHVFEKIFGHALLTHEFLLLAIEFKSYVRKSNLIKERALKKGVDGMNSTEHIDSLLLPINFFRFGLVHEFKKLSNLNTCL